MPFDPLATAPYLTADLPGVGGRIKHVPEDFEVEEIPAYEPSGQGEFLYLWVEKRDMGAEYFVRQIAQRLQVAPGEVGSAGMKDRHAVTRQMISVPAPALARLSHLEGNGIRLLNVGRHSNKLRPGHLRGNRFQVVIRELSSTSVDNVQLVADRILKLGLPNYYGPQRFGRDGETSHLGFTLLGGPARESNSPLKSVGRLSPWLRRLALSAAQSVLFNHCLSKRISDGLYRRVLPGDVMSKWPFGGIFVAKDVEIEQARFDAREIVSTGPMFGRKMFESDGQAAQREADVLSEAGLTLKSFFGFGKLLQGTRRKNLIYVDDLQFASVPKGIRLSFSLPPGSYATVLLGEFMKNGNFDGDEPDMTM
jgi:tRNA pseudouridine13 synthase